MPRRCSICAHAQREAIDRALVAGAAVAAVSRTYRISEAAIRKRANDIYGLVVDGLPPRVILEFVRQNCDWTAHRNTLAAHRNTLAAYIRRAQNTFVES
jgi:hypothetical protein